MAISKGWKIALAAILFLVVIVVSTPFIAHAFVKNKIDEKLENEFGGLAHYDAIRINWSPLGAQLTNLRLGDVNPAAGNKPTIQIATADVVLASIFSKEPHFKSATAHDFTVNISVDSKGESSLAKLIREKVPSKRTRPLTIDNLTLDGITVTTFVAASANLTANNTQVALNSAESTPPAETSANAGPDSIVTVASIKATDFVLPIPRQLLGYEHWISTTIENIEAFDPRENSASKSEPCVQIGRIAFELDQAETTEVPVRIRNFTVDKSNLIVTGSLAANTPGFKHVVESIQQGFGFKEPKEISENEKYPRPHGTGLTIADFHSTNSTIDMRGGSGVLRFSDARIEAGPLAFGDENKSAAPADLKLDTPIQSGSRTGNLSLSITNLTGHYPRSSFQCSYHVENLDAVTAASMARSSSGVEIQAGSMSLSFAGGASDGNLNIEGSVTLSDDFKVGGPKGIAVSLLKGRPIDHVRIDGTLEHPQIHLPNDLAMLGELMGNVLAMKPLGIIDATVGQVPVIGGVLKETTKAGSSVLGKIPIIGEIFKKDKNRD